MAATKTRRTVSACAAAVGLALSLGASAQSTDAVQSGLDRAIRLPLEIIWLQSEIQADLWRNPALAHALQGCTKIGTPKEGCAVSVRSSWRYTFDASSAVRPAPIVVSSLSIPGAPFAAGRLNLSGSGRVYLVTSSASSAEAIRPPAGAILLAAGSTVQLVDAAYPSIQIEVKAPQDRPLFLGNLAEADVTKVVALLVKQADLASASAANVLENGQIALRAPTPAASAPVAAVSPYLSRTESQPDLSTLAGHLEVPVPLTQFQVASVDLNALAGRLDMPVSDVPRAAASPFLDQDFTLLAAALEKSAPLPGPFSMASIDFSAIAGRLETPTLDVARATEPPLDQDFTLLAGAVEKADPLPVSSIVASVAAPRVEPAKAPAQLALASPSPAPAADIAKMRAEIEAEIARERERIAQALQARGTTRFRFGT